MDIPQMTKVPWTGHGYYPERRPVFSADPLWHAGVYYVQEPSSMFLEAALKQCLDLNTPQMVLDLCAAPGGKSTHILSLLSRDSVLVSNEVIKSRVPTLAENLVKWGYPNMVITQSDPSVFERMHEEFDAVIVDAPCSGEGLFRKDANAYKEWSESNVDLCAARQNRILGQMRCLKTGGVLIYSTCTYEKTENEDQIARLVDTGNFESMRLDIPADWGVTGAAMERNGKSVYGYRFYPHKVKGEGFFLSILKKIKGDEASNAIRTVPGLAESGKAVVRELEEWTGRQWKIRFFENGKYIHAGTPSLMAFLKKRPEGLYLRRAGIRTGRMTGKQLIPDHSLAVSLIYNRRQPEIELNREQALEYLARQSFDAAWPVEKGWIAVTYQNTVLGWIKKVPGRMNNYYPKEWRRRNSGI